ncbi:DUF6970 domain-containing protein [Polaribacter porphyrae]|uniref:DUF6970 domain-containing protein n=1 Tax=Polaribacter porphyrae TaxID=1137780 RepID=A0A2S7WRE1_9FLAO|nr:hypothetical protein [Polaribacter porphyrae]PQJ80026.1 hypothetical protein BTO18_12965 [Polaribacter porphyrae]
MKTFLMFFSVIFLTSCPANTAFIESDCNVEVPIEDLAWLKEIKTSFEQSTSVSKKKIIQYDYKNETVFLINSCDDCSDNLVTVYNCDKEVICEFGGIAGLNTCSDFEKEAINEKILWEN